MVFLKNTSRRKSLFWSSKVVLLAIKLLTIYAKLPSVKCLENKIA